MKSEKPGPRESANCAFGIGSDVNMCKWSNLNMSAFHWVSSSGIDSYWIGGEGTYISHNDNSNNARNWTFQWTAPSDGAGDALFTIYFNVVNGVGTNGDQWGYITAVSIGTPQEIAKSPGSYTGKYLKKIIKK